MLEIMTGVATAVLALVAILTFVFKDTDRNISVKSANVQQQNLYPQDVNQTNINSHNNYQQNINPQNVVQQNFNQQRKIIPQPEVKKEKHGEKFILRAKFNQTEGLWDSGTLFKAQFRVSGPYERASFISGLPLGQREVNWIEDKVNGFYSYSMRTAPNKGQPIIVQFISENDIDLLSFNVTPK